MYKTQPKTAIFVVLLPLIAAFTLPAIMAFPSIAQFPRIAQSAAGLHTALLLLTALCIRMILLPSPEQTWLEAARLPLAIIAGSAALGYAAQDDLGDVARQAGLTAALVALGVGAAWAQPRYRPKTWGFALGRNVVAVLVTFILLLIWNHGFRFATAQGAALVNDLVVIAIFANAVMIGQVQSNGDWTVRLMTVCSFCIYINSIVVAPSYFAAGAFDPIARFVLFASQALVMAALTPWAERMAARHNAA